MKTPHWLLGTLAVALWSGLATYSPGVESVGGQSQVNPNVPPETPEEAARHLRVKVEPLYPPLAKLARVDGRVRIEVLVNTDGSVARVVQSSGHPLLARAAIEAAKKYRYEPFVQNGAAVPAIFWVEIDFELPAYKPHSVPFPEIRDYGSIIVTMDAGYHRLKITGDGTVEFEGKNYVVIEGTHRGKITAEEFRAMVEAFRAADFYSLDDEYGAGVSDAAFTETSIQIGGERKKVRGCLPHEPPALRILEDAVAKLSHSDQWVVGNAETVPGILNENQNRDQAREILSKALPAAATYSTAAEVADFLRAGANTQQTEQHFDGCTALMRAAERGLPDMVRLLLQAGADPRLKDHLHRTALMFAATSGNAEVLSQLLPAGMVNARSQYGTTALMAAAAAGNPALVQMLLRAGAQVNDRDKLGSTALIAGSLGDLDSFTDGAMMWGPRPEVPDGVVHRDAVVRLLLEAGADIHARNRDGETALFSLEDDAVRELIAHRIDLNVRNEYGETALMETVSDDIAKLLIEGCADVNARDRKGRTALMRAAENNYFQKIRALTATPKLQIDRREHEGNTALMIAAGDAHPDCVKVLLDAHADMNQKDKSGWTALQIAEAGISNAREGYKIQGFKQTVDLLHKAGAPK
jgi:TonB family protein